MANELRFTDPAFSCEVTLRGVSKALFDVNKKQFERLKEIRSLGLGGHLGEHCFHSRFQHLIGLQRIFEKLLLPPKGQGLPKEFLWSFWVRLCFCQTGHAAFSYDAERAVLLAAHLDKGFRAELELFLEPVLQEASNELDSHAAAGATPKEWLSELISKNQWRRLHRWVAALKLTQADQVKSILMQQKPSKQLGDHGYDYKKSLRMLLDPACDWSRCCRNLSRLDFVIRDLTYAGRMGVTLDVDRLVSQPKDDEDPDWRLLGSLYAYLADTLYSHPSIQLQASLFHRQLARRLIDNKIKLAQLFGTDAHSYFTDRDVISVVESDSKGKDIFDPLLRESWHTWTIKASISELDHPASLEQKLAGSGSIGAYLNGPYKRKLACVVMEGPKEPKLGFSIRHHHQADRPLPADILKSCSLILNELYPRIAVRDVHRILAESFSGHDIEHRLTDAVSRLADIGTATKAATAAAKFVSEVDDNNQSTSVPIRLFLEGLDKPVAQSGFYKKVMSVAIAGDDALREKLEMPLSKALRLLWSELFTWQHRLFPAKPIALIDAFRLETQLSLKERVVKPTEGREFDLELYTLLESLVQPAKADFRISLPGVVLKDDHKQSANEYDVLSFVLQKNQAEVWIWGVTTEAKLEQKRKDDTAKIQKLRDLLGNRWDTDVRAVFNYVHIEKGQIVLDVNGVQERR